MRIDIRTKLVLPMIAVALLPLLAALVIIVVGGRNLRREIFGQGILSAASSEARVMQTELEKDIELLKFHLREHTVLDGLNRVKAKRPDKELAKLDREWPNLSMDSSPLRKVLRNPTSDILKVILDENDRLTEILVTDRFGQLIAATQQTTDFYQGDEEWWQKCYNDGRGEIYVPYIDYDRSSKAWAVDLCIPIMDQGSVIGVAKAVLSLNRWLPECTLNIAGRKASLQILGEDGYILHSAQIIEGSTQPLAKRLENWESVVSVEFAGKWRVTPEDTIQAYVPVALPLKIGNLQVEMSRWIVVLYMPLKEAQKGLTRLSLLVLLIGVLIIIVLFVGGLVVVDRSLINRIRRISQSARRVAEGELQHRADASWAGTRPFGTDEIDGLARDFNNMVRKLQKSYVELTEANLLKENFIRIAGHELRTPLSYIVGMASLMKNVRDPDRLAKAIDTMGFKAGRLDEIIQAMFKLIPEQALVEGTTYTSVNLSKLLEKVYLDCQPWIERREQRLVIEPVSNDIIIQADEPKLRDILENLTMNAIKFTPNGGLVRISVHRQLGGYIIIKITDQGPGIPPSDCPHIFEPFYSGSDVLKHSTGKSGYGKKGMGLGLAIVKHFVDLHGGSIEFTTSTSGSTFIVQLPIEPSEKGSPNGA
ncbi:MAG TPA: HAMP domain-containing histidine kinase [Phycisphaerae bacterium]|nr:HAMP domain-containing histidine kinase [Phycisphaerae bacterium]